MTRKYLISLMIGAIVNAMPNPPALHAQDAADAARRGAQEDLQQLAATLNDVTAPVRDRIDAARRLVSRGSDDAKAILRAALTDLGRPGAQVAAARGLVDDPKPDAQFIDPLFAMVEMTRAHAESAAEALSRYQGNRTVMLILARLVKNLQLVETSRIAAIGALGSFCEKEAASELIEVLVRDQESPGVRDAAAVALVELTGISENGGDAQRWIAWWTANRDKEDVAFRTDLLIAKAIQRDLLIKEKADLGNELVFQFREIYESTPEASRGDRLLRLLRSPEPQLRRVGASIVARETEEGGTSPAAAREFLRTMVGDSSADVRFEVAKALGNLNDAGSLESLLAQLAQESEPRVRVAIARALANMRDLRVVPELLKLLDDPSLAAAEAGANSLESLGEVIRSTDASLAARVGEALRRTLEQRAAGAGTNSLREACIEAMVPLRLPELLATFKQLLESRQSPRARRFALKGLGEISDPNSADAIVDFITDPDQGVRHEAVIAIGRTDPLAHIARLFERLNPNVEPDESVRTQAWLVIETVLPDLSKENLRLWADRFRREPSRRLTLLSALRDKLIKAGDDEDIATVQQQIGETYITLKQPADAIAPFRAAFQYRRALGVVDVFVQQLIEQIIEAHLLSKQYEEATQFLAEQIAVNPVNQDTGAMLLREAERLRDAQALDDAMLLIAAARTMQPPLANRFLEDLRTIEADVRARVAEAVPTTRSAGDPEPAPVVPAIAK